MFSFLLINLRLWRKSSRKFPKYNFRCLTQQQITKIPTKVTTSPCSEIKDKKYTFPDWRLMPSTSKSELLKRYSMLSKIPLTTGVVMSAMFGYAIAPAAFDLTTFGLLSISSGLMSCASGSINQFNEVPFDAQMSRMKDRVLVNGQLTPMQAMKFATATTISSIAILYFGINASIAPLGFVGLVLYSIIYTPLKRITVHHSTIGFIADVIPPLTGWIACTGTLSVAAFIPAGLFYSWNAIRFHARSWEFREEYCRTGYRMMSIVNPARCRKVTLRHSVLIQGLCMAAPIIDITNWWFVLEVTPINSYIIYLAYQFYKDSTCETAKKMYSFYLIHLVLLMFLFIINKKKWYTDNKTKQD